MNFKSIPKIIKKYSKEIPVFSENSTLDKKTGRFTKNRIKKIRKMALFLKSEKYIIETGRGRIEADIKIYSFEPFYVDDKNESLSDEIIYKDMSFKIVSCIERDEANPIFYISHGVRIDDRDE